MSFLAMVTYLGQQRSPFDNGVVLSKAKPDYNIILRLGSHSGVELMHWLIETRGTIMVKGR